VRPISRLVPGLALAVLAVFLLGRAPDVWAPEWDSALYLLLGQSLARGDGYTYLDRPFFLRPPGFPWLLSFFTDGGPYDPATLGRLVHAFAAASAVAIYAALRGRCGRWPALAVALLSATSPLFAGLFGRVLSDFPFVFLLFTALGLLDLSQRRDGSWWIASVSGAVVLAAAVYLRTAALVVLPLLVPIALLGQRRDEPASRRDEPASRRDALARAALPTLLVLALALPWLLWARQAAAGAETPSEQLLLFDYRTAVLHMDPGDPGSPPIPWHDLLGRVVAHGAALARDLSALLLHSREAWAAGLATLLVLAGFARRSLRGLSIFEGFAAGYAAVLLTYFTYDPRLAVPLAPFAVLYGFEAIAGIAGVAGRAPWGVLRRGAAPALLGLAFAAILCGNLASLPRLEPAAQGGFPELGRWLREHTPEDAVILCAEAPTVSYLSGRRAYSYLFARGDDLLAKHGVDYVVLDPAPPPRVARLVNQRTLERWEVAGRSVFRVAAAPGR
jgi:hypothetical protein